MSRQEIEIIGMLASAVVLVSMLAKTMSYRGTMFMRIINTLGCFIFIFYGLLLPSFASVLMNSIICVVNIVYIIREYRNQHKNKI